MSYQAVRYVHNPEVLSDDEREYQMLKMQAMRHIADYADTINALSNYPKFLDKVASKIEEIARSIR